MLRYEGPALGRQVIGASWLVRDFNQEPRDHAGRAGSSRLLARGVRLLGGGGGPARATGPGGGRRARPSQRPGAEQGAADDRVAGEDAGGRAGSRAAPGRRCAWWMTRMRG